MKLSSIGNVGTGLMNAAARMSAVSQINAAADPGSTRTLGPGRVEKLKVGKDRTIGCIEGWLWVTRTGDPRDYVLERGQSMVLSSRSMVFVGSPQGAAYSLD
jgi:hypothetical protein